MGRVIDRKSINKKLWIKKEIKKYIESMDKNNNK